MTVEAGVGFLSLPHDSLHLGYTLGCGQAFRWQEDSEGWWASPYSGRVIRIRQADEGFLYQTLPGEPDHSLVSECFRLDDDIAAIYGCLADVDPHLHTLTERFRGLRIIHQEPEEALLSFVCSTANSVCRISSGVETLSGRYGRFIAHRGGRDYHSFPEARVLASADPDELAQTPCLLWRGANAGAVAQQLMERPDGWLRSLSGVGYRQAHAELSALKGVGAKIADCVCLFALGYDEAVPVDTHIRRVAARRYAPETRQKTLTARVYDLIGDGFRERFGRYAGWAQQFLFYEDLLGGRGKRPEVEGDVCECA